MLVATPLLPLRRLLLLQLMPQLAVRWAPSLLQLTIR